MHLIASRWLTHNALRVSVAGFVLAAAIFGLRLSAEAQSSSAQVAQGRSVYVTSCQTCHGANLQGQSGPPLTGATFRSYLNGYRSASDLYDFISKQMPANAPGTLSQANYLAVTAFVLQRNNISLQNQTLSGANLANIRLTATRITPQTSAANTNEIVRAAPPTRKTYGNLPEASAVNVTDDMLQAAPTSNSDWLLTGRAYDNQRYSPLDQITADNIKSLTPVALVQTGMTASFETTPIVVHGIMYVTTPVVSNQMKIFALNAATGERIWEVTDNLGSFQICCGPVNRGVAIGYGKVYYVTLDDRLVALDAASGRTIWQKSVADPSVGYSETLAPTLYKGKVIIGSAGGEWGIRGFAAAYSASTGAQVWRWWSTDPATYAGDSWKSGGAMPWTTPAVDPERSLVILSTGNPNPDLAGAGRKGDNRWSDSIVALDANTGKLKWGYQEVKHDVWDYDAVSNPVLFDVDVNGKQVPAVGEAGKVGWIFILNRENGQLIRKSDPYVMFSKNVFSQPTKAGVNMLPGANGGAEWSPPAYSPKTHLMYVLAMNQLMKFTTAAPKEGKGQIRLGSAFTNVAPGGIQNGPFVAVNMDTGKIAWQYTAPQPLIGGALATAGNLVFMGEGNGWFDAFNATSGERVWRYQLGAGVNAPPVSYEVNGEQYIAVAAGGNFQLTYPYGDTIAIFKLNK